MGSSSVFPGDRIYNKTGGQENPITIKEIFNVIKEEFDSYFEGSNYDFIPEYVLYNRELKNMGNYNETEDESSNDTIYENEENVDVTYKIKKRKHFEQSSRKPIEKNIIKGDTKEEQYIEEGEMFDVYIEFGFWATNYHEVTKCRERFEEFIYKKLYNFKQKGIIKFLFEEQKEDGVVEINNNYFAHQRVIYYLRNSRVLKKPYSPITDINISQVNDQFQSIQGRNIKRKL